MDETYFLRLNRVVPKLGVVCLIHFSHSACANRGGDLVGTESCTSRDFPMRAFIWN